jgi:hypothetical protein
MAANEKAASPSKVGTLGKAASKTHLHNSQFRRKNKEIDWWFVGILGTVSIMNLLTWMTLLALGGGGGL